MIDSDISNELKVLALEAISNAGSGHSGSVMSAGDILFTLYTRHLISGTRNENLRDRFVLSNGHACAGLYSILAGLNYFPIEELKHFRQYGGLLTGHPELNIPGIDCATGPLGQGVANAVGMAIAETVMDARFHASHYTYCMVGDGCLEEGVGLEALSIAGLYKLNKFILLYDKNDVTLDGKLNKSSIDNMKLKFKSMGFNVIECDGHNIEKIDRAIDKAKSSKDKPTVIIFKTIIGKDTALAGSNLSHGKAFSKVEIEEIKKKLNVQKPFLDLSVETKNYLALVRKFNDEKLNIRKNNSENFLKNNKDIEKNYKNFTKNALKLKNFNKKDKISTRVANNLVLNEISKNVENLLVLSADLSSSTKVKIENGGEYSATNRLGKNIAVGIREHAMGAIANGIALHGEFVPICSTFLTFSNYMMPAIRMASIMKLRVLFTFTHSSIFDTPDGVTHLPVEQLDQLRLIPNMTVARPADINECAVCYNWLLNEENKPMCLVLSRGNLPPLNANENMLDGAYLLKQGKDKITILSSGSEIQIALDVAAALKEKYDVNIVSVISIEKFEQMEKAKRNKLLKGEIFVIESSPCVKYLKYTSENHIFNVRDFGVTGDEKSLKNHFGFTAENISKKILKILK